MVIGYLVETYSHKLLQLLPLHAGSELALLGCVEAVMALAKSKTGHTTIILRRGFK